MAVSWERDRWEVHLKKDLRVARGPRRVSARVRTQAEPRTMTAIRAHEIAARRRPQLAGTPVAFRLDDGLGERVGSLVGARREVHLRVGEQW